MRVEQTAVCEMCRGTGWVASAGSRDAVACSCQKDTRKQQRLIASLIPKRYIHCTLSSFSDRAGNPKNSSLTNARRRVGDFIDCWPATERGLLLMGPCGVGKTHLAVSTLQEIIHTDKPGKVLFCNFQDLIQQIHASFSSDGAPSKSELVEPLVDADLLVLDELGSQKPSSFVLEVLYSIINSRYNAERVTIFTTNFFDDRTAAGDETLEDRIGVGLRSRIYEMTEKVILTADDYRKRIDGRKI